MSDLLKTSFHDLHVSLGARMTAFAGYDMPLQYASGVMKEHLHTRSAAGLFDVSHMGQVRVRPKSGNIVDAARAMETLVPVDVIGLKTGRQRYAFFTNDLGGIEDDLMITNRGDHLFVVVNAACKEADIERMRAALSGECLVDPLTDRALLALQGPKAVDALATLVPDCTEMRFMDVRELEICGANCIVSRCGYSGEDGFEISIPEEGARAVGDALLAHEAVEPIGLGARDSLRLEAGLCLYGNDIDSETTPVAAALEWAIQKVRRKGGDRAGGFPGAEIILDQLDSGAPRRRVGIKTEGRAPVRADTPLYEHENDVGQVGHVTSGVFGPSLQAPVAMGYVPTRLAEAGTQLFAEVRGKRLPVKIAKLPFIELGFKR